MHRSRRDLPIRAVEGIGLWSMIKKGSKWVFEAGGPRTAFYYRTLLSVEGKTSVSLAMMESIYLQTGRASVPIGTTTIS